MARVRISWPHAELAAVLSTIEQHGLFDGRRAVLNALEPALAESNARAKARRADFDSPSTSRLFCLTSRSHASSQRFSRCPPPLELLRPSSVLRSRPDAGRFRSPNSSLSSR